MIQIKPIEYNDCQYIINWNNNKDENYLYQWAGHKIYTYPLTLEQITNRLTEENTVIFKILYNSEIIGSIELFMIDKIKGSARVCRFILRDGSSGKGLGQKALKAVIDFSFNELNLTHLELGVFTYNFNAVRCYEKAGFIVKEYHEAVNNPLWNSYIMEINRK